MSQFIEIFYGMETTPVKDYIDDSFPGEWGTEDKDGNGVKVIRTTNFTNSGKLNLADVVTRSIEDRKVVRKQIKKYDTILERSGGTADNPVGRVVLFEEDNLFLCNNFTQVLRFKDVDPRFAFYALYYFYQTNRTAIRSMGSKTTGIQNLNMSKYLEIGIPNASDEDQKAFVTIAEQADKSEFVGCKSQFIEMFGDTHMRSDHSRQWKEVVEIINGKDYKSIQVEDGGYPVYGTGGEMARASDYLSPANSILLGRKGTIDKPLLIREKYWNVDTAFGAVPDEKVLHYVYFYWHCKTIDFNVLNKGTTLPSTTKVDLLNLWIKIPSMEEQTRFGSIVEQADKSEFVGCKSQFIEIFYGMETTPVKDYIDDSFPGEWGTEDKDGNGVKVIRTTNFTNSGKLNLADVVTRSIEDRKVVRKQIKKYDTILERSGGTADNPVGRVVLFEEDNLFLCNNFTQVLRFKDVDPRFAFYALYYFYQTNRTAIRSMGSKTTGIQNLNMSKYLEIGIPNASDEDQKAFVTIAEQADKSEFVGCKSQFIEMFGDTHMRSDHSRQWKEVVEIINGKDYKSIQVEDGGYPVYGTGGEMARASDYLSPANSILLGRKGTIDKPLLIREKYWNVDTAFGAVPDEKVLHYVYFYWHCKTIDFNVLNKGTTLPSTTKVDLLNLWIKIPSMEEQTRFGSIVEQADKSEILQLETKI